jgi:predicted 2-oxoglutarate/Fe(II)-dependent dioxygenase YbiX
MWNDTIDSDQYVAAHLRASIEPLFLRYRGDPQFPPHFLCVVLIAVQSTPRSGAITTG